MEKFKQDASRFYKNHTLLKEFKKHLTDARDSIWDNKPNKHLYPDIYPILIQFDFGRSPPKPGTRGSEKKGGDIYAGAFKPLTEDQEFSEYGEALLIWMCWRRPDRAKAFYKRLNLLISDSEEQFEFQQLYQTQNDDGEVFLIMQPPVEEDNPDSDFSELDNKRNLIERIKNYSLLILSTLFVTFASGIFLFHYGGLFSGSENIAVPPNESKPVEQPITAPETNQKGADSKDIKTKEDKVETEGDKESTVQRQKYSGTEYPISIPNGIWDDLPLKIWTHHSEISVFEPYLDEVDLDDLELAASAGNKDAQTLMAVAISSGRVLEYSIAEAHQKLSVPACNEKQPFACYWISQHHRRGLLGAINISEAQRFDILACQYGNQVSCVSVALALISGISPTKKDTSQGAAILEDGCAKYEYYDACTQMGWYLERGEYLEAPLKRAQDYFEKGCKFGSTDRCN